MISPTEVDWKFLEVKKTLFKHEKCRELIVLTAFVNLLCKWVLSRWWYYSRKRGTRIGAQVRVGSLRLSAWALTARRTGNSFDKTGRPKQDPSGALKLLPDFYRTLHCSRRPGLILTLWRLCFESRFHVTCCGLLYDRAPFLEPNQTDFQQECTLTSSGVWLKSLCVS